MPCSGFLTPSSFADLMSNGKGKDNPLGKTALRVVDQLVADMIGLEREEEIFTPLSCQWGKDHESWAIQTYTERTFNEVQHPVEFRASKTHPYVGGTMDGLIGSFGGVEVKCPFNSLEHLGNLEYAKQLDIYKYQIQGYMWIFELDWIDFISFDPRFPEPYIIAIHRVLPDWEMIKRLQERCELAYNIALDKVEKIKEEYKNA